MTKKDIINEGIRLGFWADNEGTKAELMKWSKALLQGQLEAKKSLQEWRRANGWHIQCQFFYPRAF